MMRFAEPGISLAIPSDPERLAAALARDSNPLKSELITLSPNSQTVWYLDRLVETGIFGNNRAEAARVALYDHCKPMIAQRILTAASALPGRTTGEVRPAFAAADE